MSGVLVKEAISTLTTHREEPLKPEIITGAEPEEVIHSLEVQLQISHKGDWCIFEKDRLCQEYRCSECAVRENHS